MGNLYRFLLFILGVALIRAQDLAGAGGQQAAIPRDLEVGDIEGTGTFFNIQFWRGDPVSWREWGPWGDCSGSCGVGLQTRRRRCWVREVIIDERDITNEAERAQGQSPGTRQGDFTGIVTGEGCIGYAAQAQGCSLNACIGTYLPWSPWSQCNAPCGDGTRFRSRECQGPGDCIGESFQSADCNLRKCYSWTEWTSYSACSETCGSGQSFRTRRCAASDGSDAPSLSECPDPFNLGAFQSQPCSIGACYQFTAWTSWSSCSAPCGAGQISRSRRCVDIATNLDAPDILSCADPLNLGAFQSQSCNLGACYSWTQWTSYSDCSAPCGSGQSFRTRRCAASDGTDAPSLSECPDPFNLGAFQAQSCNLGPCYSWTQWTAYSQCSARCGDGQSFRSRRCAADDGSNAPTLSACPDPLNLGTFQSQPCSLGRCYEFTDWTSWSSCSAPCGAGQISRSRRCVDIATNIDAPTISSCADPQNLGAFQSQSCNLGPCYSWTQWTAYSECSEACGDGQTFRTRRCAASDGTDAPTLAECPDPFNVGAFQAQSCNLGPCYRFTEWTSWSSCSAPCGDGQITRTRRCIDIDTNIDAPTISSCDDPLSLGAFQAQPCNLGPCYSWTQWTDYSQCSQTCGAGQSFRSRRCAASDGTDAPTLSECPDPLNLGAFQAQPCSLGPCYQFTEWTSWSSCSAPCGDGQITRSRRCIDIATNIDAPTISSCADPLNLGAFQVQPCNLGPCYSWTQWTAYSECSQTCGAGQSFRSRRCAASDGTDAPTLAECPDPLNLGAFQAQPCSLGPCYQFTEWTSWSSCSASCGEGQITRTRRCIDIATNIDAPTISSCADPLNLGAFQAQPCNLGPCYSWTQWTAYSECSQTCGAGQSFRSRRCAASDGTDAPTLAECPDPLNLGAFQAQPCSLGPCYQFTEWTSWSSCSASCGEGQITRTRRCIDIATNIDAPTISNCADPLNLGAFQVQPCNLGPCYSWTQWTDYSECSQTCGAGQSFRSRRCAASDGTDAPTLAECPDPLNLGAFQAQPCSLGPCYQFTEWTSWSSCSASCGEGQITRTRRCIDIATNIDAPTISSCADPLNLGAFQAQPCNLGPCYSWTQWTAYSECSQTCGAGQSFRSRRCAASDGTDAPTLAECPDPLNLGGFQAQPCSLGPCYQFTEWTSWSSCSASCGEGQITRTRRCIDIATNIDAPTISSCADPLNLGAFQVQPCNLGPCYSWTQWTDYSECSQTCGAGQSFRSRRCAASDGTDAPTLAECPDPLNLGAFQAQPCSLGPCYQFTEWTSWSSCSASCGDGQITRSRRCIDIATNIDAPTISSCDDPLNLGAFQAQPCNLGPCYSWTQWTDYSQCSQTCGAGQSFRSRRCAAGDGTDAPTLSECPDPLNLGAFQAQPCNLGPCYQFTEWTSWSSCSASCGDGIISRTRRCIDIATNIDAPTISSCADPQNLGAFQSQACNLGPCYSWTQWTAYSDCSASCGDGQSFRTRRCAASDGTNAPTLEECPDPQNLGSFQAQPCNLGTCYSWTQWTAYSQCSVTCGDGQSFRTRRCAASDGSDAPSVTECPDPSNLGTFQAQACNLEPCYGWTLWGTYSSCSVTCGAGVVSRVRKCSTEKGDSAADDNCQIPGQPGSLDTQTCQEPKCYSWTQWTVYTSCSATCGSGQSYRTRRCSASDGTDANTPAQCRDPFNLGAFQTQNCNLGPCYRFAQWGSWSRCDSQCGQGNMQRVRGCETVGGQPGPNSGCSGIPTDFIIRATCMKPACPGVFRPWSSWGECSLTCHAGVRVRTRTCSADRCIGRSREAQICNDIPCADRPRGTWTAWSDWTPCTNPCGGTSTQTRVCIGGRSPTDCGRDCEEYRRTKTCTDCPRGGPFSIGSCEVLGVLKEDCGYPGITSEECTRENSCCYDDTAEPGTPWCYQQNGNYFAGGSRRSLETEPPAPPSPTVIVNNTDPMDM